ncbi:MAG TPA: MOSC domain-containing protein [Candidatus Saccharimonadales bacterium]|nr:MOSC domain-containing protein [Candidatus Saccharimonadales bacterium]
MTIGQVVSLHLHPAVAGEPLHTVREIFAEAGRGIVGNGRKFGHKDRRGQPSRRQVSLIGREQIAEHAGTLGLGEIPPGAVRSNIETAGVDLLALVGQKVKLGGALLYFYEPRTPCYKMDLIAPGLRELMANGRQGVLAQIIESGNISVGDAITTFPS